jgi:hypothetical protein
MRTQILSPSIAASQHKASSFGIEPVTPYSSVTGTTGTGLDSSYNVNLPSSMNIFTAMSKVFSIKTIADPFVRAKVLQILNALNEAIVSIPNINNVENYLSKLQIVAQEDKSFLIEWNFQKFRIGFVVCKPVEDSYYFFVFQDEGSFASKSEKIENNVVKLAGEAVRYVIENT